MANETRHAAWQSERCFAVRLLPEEGDPTELADGLGDFLEAVDFAVEWLAREDPERTGAANLAIFETSTGEAEKVWAYPPDDAPEGAPLMKIFGFDPVNWKAASEEYSPREPALGTFFTRAPVGFTRPPVDGAATPPSAAPVAPIPAPVAPPAPRPVAAPYPPPVAALHQAPVAPPSPPPVAAPHQAPVAPPPPTQVATPHSPPVAAHRAAPVAPPRPALAAFEHDAPPSSTRPRVRARRALAAAWDDPVARSFLFLAGISLWLAVAFSAVSLLAFVLLALSGLWWRRDKLIGMVETDGEDWL